MDVILGIDIGGSTTKVVGLRTDGTVVSMLRVRAEDQVTSLYGALGNYLTSNGLTLQDVKRVVLTGVGASYVEGDIFGLPTCKVDEFSASGTGALALSGQDSAVVATMGTGTAFLWAERNGAVNLVLQAIGTMTVLACQCCGTQTVVLTGSMTTLDQVKPNFENFEKLYGIHYIIPENATFATAIGAGLCSLKKRSAE